MRLRNSFWAMLRPEKAQSAEAPIEEIRQAMLQALERHCGAGQLNIESEIGFASDLATLWYLRPKLLQAISIKSVERLAERELRNITALFAGHYPEV
jgi:hypothetical protein